MLLVTQELDGKILLLKIHYTSVVEHRERNLELTGDLPTYWLASEVLEGDVQVTVGEKKNIKTIPAANPACYNTDLPGKVCLLVQ